MSFTKAPVGKAINRSFRTQVFRDNVSLEISHVRNTLCVPTSYELVCIRFFICENNLARDVIN